MGSVGGWSEPGSVSSLSLSAPAKLNLHLEVLGLRSDGFHELAMVMQTIDLADELTATPAPSGQLFLSCSESSLPVDASNLVLQAAELLRAEVSRPQLSASLHLHKRIPIGAGLAGGSSDGATALLLLNRFWQLGLPASSLQRLATQLGSDVAFCLAGGSQLCFGRGELLEPLPQTPEMGVLLIKDPSVSVSTPWAYGRCKVLRSEHYLEGELAFEERRESLRQGALLEWFRSAEQSKAPPPLRNDLQSVVSPEVESVRVGLTLLSRAGSPLVVAMSGSGPSLFALYPSSAEAAAAASALTPALADNGFEHWVCCFTPARHG